MRSMQVALALLSLFAVASFANEFVGGDVVHLTSANYDDMVRVWGESQLQGL